MKRTLILALLACVGVANAQLFYGGDPDLRNGLVSQVNNGSGFDGQSYDDFDVLSTTVITDICGNFFEVQGQSVTQAYWEIRSGVSNGNGGTLLGSGMGAATNVANGFDAFGLLGYTVTIPVNITLGPGTYYVTLAPDLMGSTNFVYLQTTSGAGGVGSPIANGNSWFNSAAFSANWVDTQTQFGSGVWDFSIGLNCNPVPEPATVAALGLGALALIRRRRSK